MGILSFIVGAISWKKSPVDSIAIWLRHEVKKEQNIAQIDIPEDCYNEIAKAIVNVAEAKAQIQNTRKINEAAESVNIAAYEIYCYLSGEDPHSLLDNDHWLIEILRKHKVYPLAGTNQD